MRQVLERLAARLAATRISTEALRRVAICLDEQCLVIAAGDLRRYSILDFQFHAAVYRASGNQYLKEMLESIKNKMRPIPLSIDIKPILDKLYEDHVRLYDALKSREADRAEEVFAAPIHDDADHRGIGGWPLESTWHRR